MGESAKYALRLSCSRASLPPMLPPPRGAGRRSEQVALLLAGGSSANQHLPDQSPELLRRFAGRPCGPLFFESLNA